MLGWRRVLGSVRRAPLRWLALFVVLVALLIALAVPVGLHATDDAAEDELMAFLRGDEDGSTDAERAAHLDRAIALAPDRARYREARALFRIDRHDLDGARADLDRAIAIEDRPYLRYLRALTLCQGGEAERALPDFDAAIAAQPDNAPFLRGRALARVAAGRAADALRDADRAIAAAPSSGEARFARGSALAALGRDADARVALDEAIARREDLVYAWRARAECHERLGDAAAARRDRAEAAAREPTAYAPGLDPFRY